MANIPLIPGAQQTYARFKRRGKKQAIEFDKATDDKNRRNKRFFKRRLTDRRQHSLKIMLERRSNNDRRNQHTPQQPGVSDKDNLPKKGRNINTTA